MESQKQINFLENPHIKAETLDYVDHEKVGVYANLFEITLTKELKIYQYSFQVKTEIGEGNTYLLDKLFKRAYKQLIRKYGIFFISADHLFCSFKKEDTVYNVKSKLNDIEYTIEINKYKNEKIIKDEDKN